MRNISIRVGVVVALLLFSIQFVYAYSSGSQLFAGKIIKTKATEIESLENANYKCNVPGSSITIRPYKGPASYVIPSGTVAKTGTVAAGHLIMGKYTSSASTVICIYQGYPPHTQTVTLNKITLFGASKGSGTGY